MTLTLNNETVSVIPEVFQIDKFTVALPPFPVKAVGGTSGKISFFF